MAQIYNEIMQTMNNVNAEITATFLAVILN